jgi:retron-type reverse transcriptase
VTRTFDLTEAGLAAFCANLTADTYVLVEATITTFSFVRLFKDRVKEVIIGNTYQLKQISLARNNTDKIDADKLCQALKAQVLSGVGAEEYEEHLWENLQGLVDRLKSGSYQAPPVKRVYIPKVGSA